MIKYDYLIIGGGIAGVTAAETIREHDIRSSIGIISEEKEALYSRVLLPSYVKKRITREQLFLRHQEDFTKRSIDLLVMHTAEKIDPDRKIVKLVGGIVVEYKKLLISSGGRVKPWGKEEDQDFIYRLQTIEDADRLFSALSQIRTPIVIGSSFISLEFLEIFVLNNVTPVLFSHDSYFFARFLEEKGGQLMQRNFERHGIRTYFEDNISEISKKSGLSVITKHSQQIFGDSFGVGVGLRRNMDFLEGSGIEYNQGGVRVNEYLETSKDGIFAAGDVAEFYDIILEKHWALGNWTNSFLQGKRAGLNMVGKREPFQSVSTYSISNLGLQLTFLGDCGDGSDSVVRVNEDRVEYERFFIRNGILVGAVLINRFPDKAHLAKLIENKATVDMYRQNFADFQFDVKSIPVVT